MPTVSLLHEFRLRLARAARHVVVVGLATSALAFACTSPARDASEPGAGAASGTAPSNTAAAKGSDDARALASNALASEARGDGSRGAGAAPRAPAAKSERKATAPAGLARLVELSRTQNRALEHVRHLCKEIGPRLTGSTNYDRAADWCVSELRSWGLDARLEKWGEFDVRFDRGPSSGHIVAAGKPEEPELVFISPAWTRGTEGPLRGAALLEPSDEAGVAALVGKVAGAWIVRRGGARGAGAPRGGMRARDEGEARSGPDGKARRAFDELCEREVPAGFVSGASGDLLVMAGRHRVDLDELAPTRRVTLRHDDHAALVERLERGEALELEFDLQHRFTPGPVPCFNVVADLVGSEKPDEFVVVGGHLDSWDGAEGAQDNATGCATTMEAARLIAACGVKPRRTIRFVLFGGEEQGLFGSSGYVATHESELERTSIALIHDAGMTVLRGLSPTYRMMPDFERVFAPLAMGGLAYDERFPFELTELDGLVNTGDSDHAPFIAKGVPGYFWEQSEEGYEHVHHTQHDRFETIDAAQLERSAQVVAIAAFGFAQLEGLLDRNDMEPLPRRRLGVQLDGTKVTRVLERGQAHDAGMQDGDVILSIDGESVSTQTDVSNALQRGGAKKLVRVRRDAGEVELAFDYGDTPDERRRAERAAARETWLRERAQKNAGGGSR